MLLDAVQSDNEDEINELMNDFDTECRAPEEIGLTDKPGNVSASILEVNIHVVDHGTTHTKKLETNKTRKSQKKIPRSRRNSRFLHILERIVFLRAELSTNLTKVLKLLIFMKKLLNLMF